MQAKKEDAGSIERKLGRETFHNLLVSEKITKVSKGYAIFFYHFASICHGCHEYV